MVNTINNNSIYKYVDVKPRQEEEQSEAVLDSIRTVLDNDHTPDRKNAKSKAARRVPKSPGFGFVVMERGRSGVKRLGLMAVAMTKRFLHRPDAPRILAALLIVYFTFTRPALVFSLFFLTLLILIILYLSFGPDAVGRWVETRFQRLKARDPVRAEILRRRAIRVTEGVAVVVAQLPKSWTSGLYLPDFNDYGEPNEIPQVDPFEKLGRQSNEFSI